jgi:eukaryotic-like serine/threonine-protein kinase
MKDPFRTLSPSIFGFGSVPGTPEEGRAYLQKRLSAFLMLIGGLWLFLLLGQMTVMASVGMNLDPFVRLPLWVWGGTVVVLWGCWTALRKPRTVLVLDVVEASAIKMQAVALAVLLYSADPRLRPDLAVMLGVTYILVIRAALVPSTALRTALLGVAICWLQPVAAYFLIKNNPVEGLPSAGGVAGITVVWSILAVLSSTTITRIIYGLERRVREATRLGQYTLEAPIGEGGMGSVFLARHSLLRRPTAVKLLPPDKAGQDAIRRFEREVQLTSQLTHPNVVAIYDYGRTPDGVFYYAMEYLEGVDLQVLVESSGRMPPARVKHVLRQIADALADAHAVGLIHRDVKPANILLLSRGRQHDFVKVLDFGLVKESSPKTQGAASLSSVTALLGTPLYVSPESISSPSKIDGRSDLYSLGCVAYFLLTGTTFVKGRSLVEVCAAHLYEKPDPPSKRVPGIPAALEALVLQMLEKDPSKRPASAADVVDALDAMTDIPAWTSQDAEAKWAGLAEGDAPPPSLRIRDKALEDTAAPTSLPIDLDHR